MSKCWYCNNELTTGDNPKHFGICNKCYDEMFKSSDTIIRSFINKISDLEAKLAEKERQVKKLNNEAQKYFEDAYCNDSIYQDKISFCIEKFQKTKKSLRDKVCLMENDEHYYPQNAIHCQDVVAIIDNKINELKEMK